METLKGTLARIEQKQDKTLERVEIMTERLVRLEERVPPETIKDINEKILRLEVSQAETRTKIAPMWAGIGALGSVILSWFLDGLHRGG